MSTIVLDNQQVHIPPWVGTLQSFRRWAHSDEFPETGRICFLKGEVWVDMSKEQFAHNQVKGEIAAFLTRLAKETESGRYFPDGYLLTIEEAGLSTNPDGIFVAAETLAEGQTKLVEGAEGGFVEMEGTPDIVLEVISRSSVEKDTVVLRRIVLAGRSAGILVAGRSRSGGGFSTVTLLFQGLPGRSHAGRLGEVHSARQIVPSDPKNRQAGIGGVYAGSSLSKQGQSSFVYRVSGFQASQRAAQPCTTL